MGLNFCTQRHRCRLSGGHRMAAGHGFRIYGIVCDGLRGLFTTLKPFPVQMCQYRMIQIVRRRRTSKPELQASVELLYIVMHLCRIAEDVSRAELAQWYQRWREFLAEKSIETDGRTFCN